MNTTSLIVLWYAGFAVVWKVFADASDRLDRMSLGEFMLCLGILVSLLLYTLRPNPNVSRKRVALLVGVLPVSLFFLVAVVAATAQAWNEWSERSERQARNRAAAEAPSQNPFKVESTTIQVDQVEVIGVEFVQKGRIGRDDTWFIQGGVKNKSSIPLDHIGIKVRSFKDGVQRDYEVLPINFRPGIPSDETRAFSNALRIESGDQFRFEVVDVNKYRNPFRRHE